MALSKQAILKTGTGQKPPDPKHKTKENGESRNRVCSAMSVVTSSPGASAACRWGCLPSKHELPYHEILSLRLVCSGQVKEMKTTGEAVLEHQVKSGATMEGGADGGA